jgi:hypothetical protein
MIALSIERETLFWLVAEEAAKLESPVNSKNSLTFRLLATPTLVNTKCKAVIRRWRNARPSGLSKKSIRKGALFIEIFRFNQYCKVVRGTL